MGRDLERFRKVCKEKGLLAGLLKTVSYLMFVARENRLEKIWKDVSLKSGRLGIKGWDAGPRLYWDGAEITKTSGLNTSIFVNGKWRDSSKANWAPVEVRPDRLTLRSKWRSLPVAEVWVITDMGGGRISCEVKLEAQKDMEIIEQKFTVILSEKFNLWSDVSNKNVRFPQFKDWADIKDLKRKSDFISVQSDLDKNMPEVTLRKLDPSQAVYSQIQNSDFKTAARFLNLVASSKDMNLKYKKGTSTFFKAEITVK